MNQSRRSAAAKAKAPKTSALQADISAAAARGYPYYVYTLSDAQGVFYVGKGTRNRVLQHEKLQSSERNGAKIARLVACRVPDKSIVAFFRDPGHAYDHERELIASYEGLTNITRGQSSAYESTKARAQAMLLTLPTFTEWSRSMTSDYRAAVLNIAGSLRGWYDRIKEEVTKQSIDPSPREIHVRSDGTHKYVW